MLYLVYQVKLDTSPPLHGEIQELAMSGYQALYFHSRAPVNRKEGFCQVGLCNHHMWMLSIGLCIAYWCSPLG